MAWLTHWDRVSVPALTLVEWEGRLGQPLWPIPAVLAVLLGLWGLRRSAPVQRQPQPSVSPSVPDVPDSGTRGWLAAAHAQARGLALGRHARVRIDDAAQVPFTLVLDAATPEQARRGIAMFADFLGGVPCPPRARVRWQAAPDLEGPLHHVFRAELARHFPEWEFHVVSQPKGAEAVFSHPDARW